MRELGKNSTVHETGRLSCGSQDVVVAGQRKAVVETHGEVAGAALELVAAATAGSVPA